MRRHRQTHRPAGGVDFLGWPGVGVVLLTAIAFLPLLRGGFDFVNLDDATAIYQNPHFRGLSVSHLKWMFTTPHMGHYQPLTWLSLALDFTMSGMDPAGYHRTNLLLHLANAFLVYVFFTLLLQRVTARSDTPAAPDSWCAAFGSFGALLFAVHPLRVESVAWVTERRDVLSGLFFVLALIFYVRRDTRPASRASYLYCLLFFVLSMSAKAWGVTFVAVLLLLDAYPLRRFAGGDLRRILVEKIPFLVVSIVFVLLASWAQSASGAMKSFAEYGLLQRIAQAAYGLCFYVVATAWPVDLYPMHELDVALDPFDTLYLSCLAAVVAVSIVLIVYHRKAPWLTVGWFAYACIVAPVLGFAQSGPQMVADRYTYLPCLPFALLVSCAVWYLAARSRRTTNAETSLSSRTAVPGAAVLVATVLVAGLGTLTYHQLGFWRNSVALWEHSVRIDGESHFALFNLAKAYEDQKRYDDSIRLLRRVLAVKPGAIEPRFNLGILLAERKHQYREAVREFAVLLQLQPDDAVAHLCIGLSYARLGDDPAALRSYRAAVRLNPRYAPAQRALGDLYQKLGDGRKAAEHRRIAQRLRRGARGR